MGTEHHGIMEVKRYMDEQGREVMEFNQVFGKDKLKEPPFYKGRAIIRIQPVSPQGVPMPLQSVPFEFMFPLGTTIKKAFDSFDEIAKKEVDEHAKKMREQAAASRVVAAGAMPTMLGPNGKPIGG